MDHIFIPISGNKKERKMKKIELKTNNNEPEMVQQNGITKMVKF